MMPNVRRPAETIEMSVDQFLAYADELVKANTIINNLAPLVLAMGASGRRVLNEYSTCVRKSERTTEELREILHAAIDARNARLDTETENLSVLDTIFRDEKP